MTIEIVNPLERQDWNDLVLQTAGYSFFHSSNWAKTLHESYGFTPLYFTRFDRGSIKAALPVMEVRSFLSGCRGVSLPFSDFCPCLGESKEDDGLLDAILDHGKKGGWKYFELRSEHPLLAEAASCRYHYIHTLDLTPGEDQLSRNLRDSTKRNIKKARKEGVTVTRSTSREAVASFCRLNSLTRRQHGLPPQPAVFFDRFYTNIISQGMGSIYLAHHQGACIAGAVYVRFGDSVIYKYGASDARHQQLRSNNLVMWEAIRDYSREGGRDFSFGRTEPENDGLRQFKHGWGGNEETVRYYRFNVQCNRFEEDTGNHVPGYTRIFSRLPLPLLETIGKYLYRHAG